MNNALHKYSVTAVMHSDGIVTAYVNDLPGILVQGNSSDDVKSKIEIVLESYIKKLQKISSNIEIEAHSFA
jgi:predicted RNase H-like HicB family nuclease